MKPKEILKCRWKSAMLMGAYGIYTEERVKTETIPESLNVYYLRHGDSGGWGPIQYQDYPVMVNYFGTFLTNATLPVEEWHGAWIDDDDWNDDYDDPEIDAGAQPILDTINKCMKKEVAR